MPTHKQQAIVGVFETRESANKAVEELQRAGFAKERIGMLARDLTRRGVGDETKGPRWEEGALTGALAGAGLGGLVGLGVVMGVLPAIGPVIAGGALAALLANTAGAAAIGSAIGALTSLGVSEREAHFYEKEFHAGRTLVTVNANGREDEARGILLRAGAYDMMSTEEGAIDAPGFKRVAKEPERVPIPAGPTP